MRLVSNKGTMKKVVFNPCSVYITPGWSEMAKGGLPNESETEKGDRNIS